MLYMLTGKRWRQQKSKKKKKNKPYYLREQKSQLKICICFILGFFVHVMKWLRS